MELSSLLIGLEVGRVEMRGAVVEGTPLPWPEEEEEMEETGREGTEEEDEEVRPPAWSSSQPGPMLH